MFTNALMMFTMEYDSSCVYKLPHPSPLSKAQANPNPDSVSLDADHSSYISGLRRCSSFKTSSFCHHVGGRTNLQPMALDAGGTSETFAQEVAVT